MKSTDTPKASVLVIDDEESMRDSCCLILAKDGFKTHSAKNGTEGLERIRAVGPDVILLDLKMPGLSGLEVLEKAKSIDPNLITIVITGYATIESAVEAMRRGAYDFLPKPFTPDQLRLILGRGLEKKKLLAEADALRLEKRRIEENFITMVSHQLRSPLVAIVQYFEVILGGMAGDVPPKQKDMMTKARARLGGLLELINDWLDVARMNRGQLVNKIKPLPLLPELKRLLDFLQPYAEEQHIRLELNPAEGSDVVLGDPDSLEQVFSNLVSNAIKYNRPGGCVCLSVKGTPDSVRVSVEDTGIGIPAEHLPYIFDEFYRVKRTEAQKSKGSGLGLTIARKIVEAHGGSLVVSSRVGRGSVFSVILPKPPQT